MKKPKRQSLLLGGEISNERADLFSKISDTIHIDDGG